MFALDNRVVCLNTVRVKRQTVGVMLGFIAK